MVKKCVNCGTELPDTAFKCYQCGGAAAPPQPVYAQPPPPPAEKKSSLPMIIAILVVVAVVIVVVVVAVFYIFVTGWMGGGMTPPVITVGTPVANGAMHYTMTVGTIMSMGNDMDLGDYRAIVYRNGTVYATMDLDDLSASHIEYDDTTGIGDLSNGDTITVEVDGTDAVWDLDIIWLESDIPGIGDDYVIGSQTWST